MICNQSNHNEQKTEMNFLLLLGLASIHIQRKNSISLFYLCESPSSATVSMKVLCPREILVECSTSFNLITMRIIIQIIM